MRDDRVLQILQAQTGPRSLYYRWEKEQWEAGRIDLASDRDAWAGLSPTLRDRVAAATAWRQLRALQATDALVRFVDAAPNEEQQVFLTTQLVDEARQVVFFDRFRTQVLGKEMSSVTDLATEVGADIRALLMKRLPAAAHRMTTGSSGLGALVHGVVLYQICVVGLLGLTEQRFLTMGLAGEVLPGLTEALCHCERDAHRHVAFGLGFLTQSSAQHKRYGGVIQTTLKETMPLIDDALARLATASDKPGDLSREARAECRSWLQAVGLESPVPL